MNLVIDDSKLSGLNAIAARENTTPEAYLTARIDEVLASYTSAEIERVKAENAAFFDLAAQLPAEKQEQLKAIVQQLAAS